MVSGDGLEKKGGLSMGTGWQGIDQSEPRTVSDGRPHETMRADISLIDGGSRDPRNIGQWIDIERDVILSEDTVVHERCQGAVFMAAKFEVFPILSLKTFTHFIFPLRTYQTNPLSLPPFSYLLTNQDIKMDEHQWITDTF